MKNLIEQEDYIESESIGENPQKHPLTLDWFHGSVALAEGEFENIGAIDVEEHHHLEEVIHSASSWILEKCNLSKEHNLDAWVPEEVAYDGVIGNVWVRGFEHEHKTGYVFTPEQWSLTSYPIVDDPHMVYLEFEDIENKSDWSDDVEFIGVDQDITLSYPSYPNR